MNKVDDLLVQEAENDSETVAPKQSSPAELALLEEMMKAGLFIGLKSSKTHPKMKPFIVGVRNGISIIDLEETVRLLNVALDFIMSKVKAKGTLLLVGTTPVSKKILEETAKRLQTPFVIERWLGGTLTNFKTLSKRIAYFKKLKSDKETGRLDKYTKKERLGFDRQIAKMSIMFGGLEDMQVLPDAVIVCDVQAHLTAVREAKRLKIPVIGVLSTDISPETVEYPIPLNTRSKASIDWLLSRVEKAVEEGRTLASATIT